VLQVPVDPIVDEMALSASSAARMKGFHIFYAIDN
jgi:hypothetical protein